MPQDIIGNLLAALIGQSDPEKYKNPNVNDDPNAPLYVQPSFGTKLMHPEVVNYINSANANWANEPLLAKRTHATQLGIDSGDVSQVSQPLVLGTSLNDPGLTDKQRAIIMQRAPAWNSAQNVQAGSRNNLPELNAQEVASSSVFNTTRNKAMIPTIAPSVQNILEESAYNTAMHPSRMKVGLGSNEITLNDQSDILANKENRSSIASNTYTANNIRALTDKLKAQGDAGRVEDENKLKTIQLANDLSKAINLDPLQIRSLIEQFETEHHFKPSADQLKEYYYKIENAKAKSDAEHTDVATAIQDTTRRNTLTDAIYKAPPKEPFYMKGGQTVRNPYVLPLSKSALLAEQPATEPPITLPGGLIPVPHNETNSVTTKPISFIGQPKEEQSEVADTIRAIGIYLKNQLQKHY